MVKLPHSRQATGGGAGGGAGFCATGAAGRSAGEMIFSFSGSIWRPVGSGSPPASGAAAKRHQPKYATLARTSRKNSVLIASRRRSEEHTSELQSHLNLVCRLLL